MADRVLKPIPPTSDYEQDGWHCIYHGWHCHNPLDCDLIPRWRLKRDIAIEMMGDKKNLTNDY